MRGSLYCHQETAQTKDKKFTKLPTIPGSNEGGFLILVACKPYAISINFGSEPFSPKQIPIGTLLLS